MASLVPTVTSGSAYSAGNCVGGLLTFPVVAQGVLNSIDIEVKSVQSRTP
jgi:hypothetical protein